MMSKLTPDQQKVVDTKKKNLIVSAGAGSGKTSTLTRRVIDIIESKTSINNILVVTFTKAASNEMKARIRAALKEKILLFKHVHGLHRSYQRACAASHHLDERLLWWYVLWLYQIEECTCASCYNIGKQLLL